ncbi:MAG TPA: hypothetical protein VG124_17215 [Beijerinckiaceae bacterium]|jgi:hypothetical protein|nr:hypothetical protein [Beijerinckiaceae bacterium]
MARPENIRVRNMYRGKKHEAFTSLRRNGKAFASTRRTPYLQGQIDGLCGLYAIINAFQYLFPASFTDDDAWELMTILCGAIAHKFPAVIWKGAGVEDTVALFKAAEKYAAATRHLKGRIVVTRPFARRKIDRVQDFWVEIGAWLDANPHAHNTRLACLGIGYPDNHWTLVAKKSAKSVTFFDSWELKRLALRQFTISQDVAKANGGMHKLDTRQTFLIERRPGLVKSER